MIEMHQARNNAEQYLSAAVEAGIEDVRLEEIELSEDDRYWHVTLSYLDVRDSIPRDRHYKIIQLDAGTGQFRAMRIREIAHA